MKQVSGNKLPPFLSEKGCISILVEKKKRFIFDCPGSLLLRAGFLELWREGPPLCCSTGASPCGGFSCGAQALGAGPSVVVARL